MSISKITGASIEDGSITLADLGITTIDSGTGNTLTLQANSRTGITIDVTGNTAIANTLTFSSTGARITGDMSNATQSNRLAFQTSTANSATALTALPSGTGTQTSINLFDNSNPTNAGTLNILSNATEKSLRAAITGSGTYLPLTMYTGGSERLRIDTSGNVGIGVVPSGTSKLDVNGQIYSSNGSASAPGFTSRGQNNAGLFFGDDGVASWLGLSAGGVERMRVIGSTGNVGINTTAPSQRLHVAAGTILSSNTAGTIATVSIAGNGSTVGTSDFALQQGTSSEAYVFNRANSYLVLGTNNTERMRIDSSGNVGIGTSSPDIFGRFYTRSVGINSSGTTALQINGTTYGAIDLGSGGTRTFSLTGTTTEAQVSTITAIPLLFNTNSTERMRIDSSGNVGIGVTPNTWSLGKALEIGTGTGNAVWGVGTSNMNLTSNIYFNSGYKFAGTGFGGTLAMSGGGIAIASTTASGTAGAAASFVDILAVSRGNSVALQGATSVAGTGITFPATQSASSDANTLDDYEEGTWTPVVTSETGTITTYASEGTYTKIGNTVNVMGYINLTTVGTAGGRLFFSGLPFTVNYSVGNIQPACPTRESTATGNIYFSYFTGGTTTGVIQNSTAGAIAWQNTYKYPFVITYKT